MLIVVCSVTEQYITEYDEGEEEEDGYGIEQGVSKIKLQIADQQIS